MTDNNFDEWELSKENVRPLKQGRSFVQLQAALNPSTNTLRQQREVFETEIRTYDGDDPLAVWVKYITWTEQNFPKGGREGFDLLQNCIDHFKACSRYFNDIRYIRVWIKFADYQINAAEFYQFMYNNKIGIQLAAFYEAWALFLERSNSTVMADAVFNKGIENGAQPLEHLLKLHSEFQARVAHDAISRARIVSEEEEEEEGVEPQRLALGALRARGKSGQAPVIRTGSHKPERLLQTTAVKQTSGSSSAAVYCDENVSSCRLPTQNKELLQVPFPEIVSRENQQKASKWTHVRVKQTGFSGNGTHHTQQLPFVLHEDTDVKQPLNTRVEPGGTNAVVGFLSSSAATNEVPMYCKSKIYAGVREMCFEELRAAAWVKRKQEQEQFQSQIQQEVQRQLQLALKSANLKPNVMQVTCQEAPPEANQPQARLCVEAGRTEEQDVRLEEQPADEDDDFDMPDAGKSENDKQLSEQIEKDARTRVSLVKEKSICDGLYSGKIVLQSEPMEDADVHMETPNMKTTQSTEPQNVGHLSRPSPTVHTKHAEEIIRNLFNFDGSHRQSEFDFEKQFQLDPGMSASVDVFVDPDTTRTDKENKLSKQNPPLMANAKQTSGAVEIYVDPSPPSCTAAVQGSQAQAFTIYVDPDPEVSSGKQQQQDRNPNTCRNSSETGAIEKRLPSGSGMIYEDPVATSESSHGSVSSGQFNVGNKWSANKVGHRAVQPLSDLFGTGDEVDRKQNQCPDADFNDEINDVEMMMVPNPDNDLFDPNIDTSFCPQMCSTKNLTNVVRFAMASGQPDQHVDKDTHMAASKLENVSIKSTGNAEPNQQNKNRKSLFMNLLDPIQEGSEDSRSRTSSADSRCHSSSSRPGSSTVGSISSSCASRSSGCQQSSHSSAEFANLQLTTTSSASRNVHKVPRMSPPGNRFFHLPEGVPEPFEDGPVGMKPAGGTFGTMAGNANDFPEESMCVDRDDHGDDCGDVCDSSILIDHVNPYSSVRIQNFLRNLSPPLSSYAGYHLVNGCLPRFAVRCKVKLGDTTHWVKSKLGEGGYAKVFLILEKTAEGDEGNAVVAKVQSPACPWEFYIASELQRRLSLRDSNIDISKSVMTIKKAFFFNDGNCFLNECHRHGTLLDFVNSYRLKKPFLPEWLVLLFSIELFHIVEQMHSCDIIHGDLKPDNVLICRPRCLRRDESAMHLIRGSTSFLKLIDFGQSIDLTMFPPRTTFLAKSSSTPALHCPEIVSYRPWNFQVDLFGLVATIYVLLTGNYISTIQKGGQWTTIPSFPRAYKSRKMWKQVFQDFLNIPDCNSLPNLADHRACLEKFFLDEFSLEEYNQLVEELEV